MRDPSWAGVVEPPGRPFLWRWQQAGRELQQQLQQQQQGREWLAAEGRSYPSVGMQAAAPHSDEGRPVPVLGQKAGQACQGSAEAL